MKEILRAIDLLEEAGFYKSADRVQNRLLKVAAWPYNVSNLDELPISARFIPWADNEEDYKQYDNVFWDELKQRIPDYRTLNIDKGEDKTLENLMNGPDPVAGPAYVFPESTNLSPSMSGGLDNFTWDQARDVNFGPDYWKNLLPRY
jgi:hypothetical protein